MKSRVMDAVKRVFRPEFINRVDEIIVFHALTSEHLKEIVNLQLRDVEKRLQDSAGLSLRLPRKLSTAHSRGTDLITVPGHSEGPSSAW